MDPILTATDVPSFFAPTMTYHSSDSTFDGLWSRGNMSLLTFRDSRFTDTTGAVIPAVPFRFRGGPIGGTGTPVQLIFWGQWWQSADGAERARWVESSTRALLDSPYTDELSQYAISSPPWFRGSTYVVSPAPPGQALTGVACHAVADLIGDLIGQDEYPDPDDGPRIAFIACMPPGFDGGVDSFQVSDRQYDPPFDTDNIWYGFIRYYDAASEPLDKMTVELSRFILGVVTDPERDGWRADIDDYIVRELPDPAYSPLAGGWIAQTGFVNGVQVCAYWSNRHGTTVLPIDTDYAARLSGTVTEIDRTPLAEGVFRPSPSDNAACSTALPECCIDDRDYVWTVYAVQQTARVELRTERFHTPVPMWTINGQPVAGEGQVVLSVTMDKFRERETVTVTEAVVIDFIAQTVALDLTARNATGNFDVVVGCTVVDAGFTGNVTSNVTVTPSVAVGLACAVLEVEQDYVDQRADCYRAMLRKHIQLKTTDTGAPGDHPGIEFGGGFDSLVIPAYAHYSGAQQIATAKRLVRAAHDLFEPAQAQEFVESLVATTPLLASALRRQNRTRL